MPSSSVRPPFKQQTRTEHRLFHITELLSMILQDAGPEAQVQALYVSHDWRSSALAVISSQINPSRLEFSRVHAPVEYGQSLDPDLSIVLQPSQQEVAEFELHAKRLLERRRHTSLDKTLYFPARFTQLNNLSDDINAALNKMNDDNTHQLEVMLAPNTGPCWLDFSQVSTNPYFKQLFDKGHRFVQRLGRWEITLRPPTVTGDLLTMKSGIIRTLQDAIGSMHVTCPPTKSLGICHFDRTGEGYPSQSVLITRICSDDGIRVAELLDTLEKIAPKVLSTWMTNAQHLRDEQIPSSHWFDDSWRMLGAPKITIHLDNAMMPSAEVDYEAFPRPDFDNITIESILRGDFDRIGDFKRHRQAKMGYGHHVERVGYMVSVPFRATRGRVDPQGALRAYEVGDRAASYQLGYLRRIMCSSSFHRGFRVRGTTRGPRVSERALVTDSILSSTD
ncbi:hypothetical protein TUN199_05085 [Pyrenophora tritici-repentis]|uniref:Uncharacterized protein n=1 Tax=Pyrenophora tritici-repentis TaxID=45151 RepID=A0A317AKR5_9PLEO|nr:hypothetical protein Alg130_04923 [Pyrenophora tritici-repentis]KAI0610850.1 hypothetical protein TUN205_04889 [Pyrenophora tritici-repentis]KAI0622930.1 hypothetical protein TUN199_05085 [Pyrenophora tritici-repentis]KAI1518402.1 hypothetical protein Ptr86124_001530 [Pyrenophora tritici-repentis]KAI1543281.1 hypothetical protein PtrSN001C_003894 [Pyrenophora tritici-repentis]